MNRTKVFAAAAGFTLAAGIVTAGNVIINGQQAGTYSSFTVDSAGNLSISGDVNTGGGGSTNAPPTASFTFSCTDLSCSFNSSGSSDSDGTIASRSWDFGDNSGSSAANPSHTYSSGNTYSVTLIVTDDDGATGSQTRSVSVSSSSGGGGGGTPSNCSGVGLDSTWSLDGGLSSFSPFPPTLGQNDLIRLNRKAYNAIQFTAPSNYSGSFNMDSHPVGGYGSAEATVAVSRCPGDFGSQVASGNCRRTATSLVFYLSSKAGAGLWQCYIEPGQTYYMNIAYGRGTGNNLNPTCSESRCASVYTFY